MKGNVEKLTNGLQKKCKVSSEASSVPQQPLSEASSAKPQPQNKKRTAVSKPPSDASTTPPKLPSEISAATPQPPNEACAAPKPLKEASTTASKPSKASVGAPKLSNKANTTPTKLPSEASAAALKSLKKASAAGPKPPNKASASAPKPPSKASTTPPKVLSGASTAASNSLREASAAAPKPVKKASAAEKKPPNKASASAPKPPSEASTTPPKKLSGERTVTTQPPSEASSAAPKPPNEASTAAPKPPSVASNAAPKPPNEASTAASKPPSEAINAAPKPPSKACDTAPTAPNKASATAPNPPSEASTTQPNPSSEASTATPSGIVLDDDINPKLLAKWPTLKLKTPPIFVHKPIEIHGHIKTLLKKGVKFYKPFLGTNYIKITCENLYHHKQMISYLKNEQLSFHTFGDPEKRKMKVVIKGISNEANLDEIKKLLESVSIPVKRVHKMHTEIEKNNTMLVLVVVPFNDEGTAILKVRQILGNDVSMEPPEDKPRQCHRCQKWGHSQRYCHANVTCVKCGGQHITSRCERTPEAEEKPSCANCKAGHTASYRQCICTPGSLQYELAQINKKVREPCYKPNELVTMENCNKLYKNVEYK